MKLHLAMLIGLIGSGAIAQSLPGQSAMATSPRCSLTNAYDANNPFARILRGELPVSLITQDDLTLAFVPLDWEHPGEALVIPKRAVRNVNDMNDAELIATMHMARRIAVAQERAFGSTGFTIQQNNGQNQGICHAHLHVIPNTPAASVHNAARAAMDAVAAKLKAALPKG
jgi:histidine triad (HIT) family protein